uniref:Tubulin polyglutamylase complex subunit 2 n=1 Tax=Spermophilus dauricus TaxID=99837 RepID=A0A8C9PR43_SPEDA
MGENVQTPGFTFGGRRDYLQLEESLQTDFELVNLLPLSTILASAQDTEIWFLDRALYWHFLTDTFTAYYRLLITHLGLPQWQYAFTRYGISPQAKQWFSMYKPITYNTDLLTEETDSFVNKLDPSKVFKSKNKPLIPKKKAAVQPAGGQKGPSGPTTSKPSSGPGNPVRK